MNNSQNTGGGNVNVKKAPSLTVAIVFIILFWPVGIYLTYKYITYDRTQTFRNSKLLRNFSIAFLVFAILGIIGSGGDVQIIVACIFFLIGGGFMLFKSNSMKKDAERYKQYIELIVNNGNDNIDEVANRAGLNSSLVEKDLNKMISLGIFANAEIDTVKRTIDLGQRDAVEQFSDSPNSAVTSVKCPNCGAMNSIVTGQNSMCEYCGTYL